MGPTHFNKLASSMNIPCIDNKTFKRYERIVGPAIEFTAKSSCIDAVENEKAATIENLEAITSML